MIGRIKYLYNRLDWALRTKKINKQLHCRIDRSVGIDSATVLKGYNIIWPHTSVTGSKIGYFTFISDQCRLPNTKIGNYCSISDHVELILGNHPSSLFVSTCPIFYRNTLFFGKKYIENELFEDYAYADKDKRWFSIIGNDVWIGKGAKIMNGVKIGDGAIIAAYAVVVKDVPAYAIVGGVPAKTIRYRFEPDEIEWLQDLKWWNKDEKWIEKYAQYFQDIKILREYVEGNRN